MQRTEWGGLSFGGRRHFEFRLDRRRVPLHRVILPAAKGLDVHHVDFNRWNNRPGNLVAISPSEHRLLHMEHLARRGGRKV